MTSLPMSFRTKLYIDSPANCNFVGTTRAFLEENMKKVEIKKTEKKIKRIGLVVSSTPLIIGLYTKSLAPGDSNPGRLSLSKKLKAFPFFGYLSGFGLGEDAA